MKADTIVHTSLLTIFGIAVIACLVHTYTPMPVIVTKVIQQHNDLYQYQLTYGSHIDTVWSQKQLNLGDTLKQPTKAFALSYSINTMIILCQW